MPETSKPIISASLLPIGKAAKVAKPFVRKLIKESPKIYKKLSEGLGHKENIGGRIVKAEVEYGKKIKEKNK